MGTMLDDIAEVLLSKEQIAQRVEELGAELSADYADCANNPLTPRLPDQAAV